MEAEVVPVLRVADAAAAVSWYERLGFTKQWEHRFDPGCPAFVSIARDEARLFLSEHRGDARPDTLVHLFVGDVDAVVAEFGRPDGEPPYGCELELRDPDGNRLRIRSASGANSAVARHRLPQPKIGEPADVYLPMALRRL
jgi:catechol 2,3-dioxygenase-like lactoylglutathione lyase family enzyme